MDPLEPLDARPRMNNLIQTQAVLTSTGLQSGIQRGASMHQMRRARAVTNSILAAMMVALAGCAGPSVVAPYATEDADAPAPSSVMICADDAAAEISAALGVGPSERPAHSWSSHVYTCRYQYSSGALVLSVKELADPTQAEAYYANRHAAVENGQDRPALGEAAFAAPDGSILVRKDSSVLLVDVTGLPDELGPQRLTRAEVALTVASVLMQCWIEHEEIAATGP